MLKGTTKSGFEYEIEDYRLDNWDLLVLLGKLDGGNVSVIPAVLPLLLDEKQVEELKNHNTDIEHNIVKMTGMMADITDILKNNQETKNS
jgi:hypothetical protein